MWPFSLFFTPKWKIISKEKREARNVLIQEAQGRLSTEATTGGDKYTRASASEIVENISRGKWTAVQVVQAYIARAILVHEQTNCITEVMFATALEEAKQLDEEYKATGKLRGPLHGVPISFKDQFEIAGKDASIGFSSWCQSPCEDDAALVKQVRQAGGIPVCKGNVPQTMLIFECSNPVWGTTVNPWNHGFTCGGSSGGEGVLLSTSSVALGLGSDVGGSLRIPSLYCGLYTLKPCVKRITSLGARSANPGFDTIISTVGPMARSVADVELLSKVIIGATPSNTHEGLAPVPYRNVTLPPRPLRFGYYLDDNWIKTSPANRRAVMMTVESLRKEGHEVSEFNLPNGPKALKIFTGLTSADGYDTILSPRHVNGDPAESNLFLVRLGPRLFGWMRSSIVFLAKYIFGDPLSAEIFSYSRKKDLKEYWALSKEKHNLIKEFYDQVWYKYDFDAIIAPGMAIPALPHGAIKSVAHLASGTLYFNVVDSPVGVIPVTRVDPALDSLTEEWWRDPKGHGTKLFEADIYKGGIYDPVKMKGLPLGVQIVGRNWEDEKVIAIMHVVDKALGPRGFGPRAWEDFQKVNQTVA